MYEKEPIESLLPQNLPYPLLKELSKACNEILQFYASGDQEPVPKQAIDLISTLVMFFLKCEEPKRIRETTETAFTEMAKKLTTAIECEILRRAGLVEFDKMPTPRTILYSGIVRLTPGKNN